jgi:hypothetical protein
MKRITAGDELARQLEQSENGPSAVYDSSGKLIGFFEKARSIEEYIGSCPISDEELRRRGSEIKGRSLAEIWKSLGVKP